MCLYITIIIIIIIIINIVLVNYNGNVPKSVVDIYAKNLNLRQGIVFIIDNIYLFK